MLTIVYYYNLGLWYLGRLGTYYAYAKAPTTILSLAHCHSDCDSTKDNRIVYMCETLASPKVTHDTYWAFGHDISIQYNVCMRQYSDVDSVNDCVVDNVSAFVNKIL